METTLFESERRFTAMLLILSTVLFVAGLCFLFFGADFIKFLDVPFDAPPQTLLAGLAKHIAAWQWGWGLTTAGVVGTALGLAMLAMLLRGAGDRTFSWLGMLAFLLGAVLVVMFMAFSLSVTVWAAQEAAEGSAVPDLYRPVALWGNMLLKIYTVLAFLGMLAYGAAILRTRLLPRWVGWTAIIWSIVWLARFLLTYDAPPLLHHVMPLVIGIMLLLRRSQVPVRLGEQEGAAGLQPAVYEEGLSR